MMEYVSRSCAWILACGLIGLLTTACEPVDSESTPGAIVDVRSAAEEEIEVYVAGVGGLDLIGEGQVYGVADHTADLATLGEGDESETDIAQLLQEVLPTLSSATLEDFIDQNRTSREMSDDDYLGMPGVPRVRKGKTLDRIRRELSCCENQCQSFLGANPGSSGIFRFSNVGFDSPAMSEREQALLYLEHYCGDPCGTGTIMLFVQDGDGWVIHGSLELWSY